MPTDQELQDIENGVTQDDDLLDIIDDDETDISAAFV